MTDTTLIGVFDDYSASVWVMHALQDAHFEPAIRGVEQLAPDAGEDTAVYGRWSRERFAGAGRNVLVLVCAFVGLAALRAACVFHDWFGSFMGFTGIAIGLLAGTECGACFSRCTGCYLGYGLKHALQSARIVITVPVLDYNSFRRAECIMREFGALSTYDQRPVTV